MAERRVVTSWLERNGLELKSKGGHDQYEHPSGVKLSVIAHGPKLLDDNWCASAMRALERCGFSRQDVRAAWK